MAAVGSVSSARNPPSEDGPSATWHEKRLELAEHVWATMKANDSRECRNCHSWDAIDFHKQTPRSREKMEEGRKEGKTCIDCHKGVAHTLPKRDD